MIRQMYRALDKPSSLLGIQGSYVKYAAVGFTVAALIGLIVGRTTIGLVGFAVFAGIGAVVYLAIIRYQSKYSERERDKKMASKNFPDYIVMPTRRLSSDSGRIVRRAGNAPDSFNR